MHGRSQRFHAQVVPCPSLSSLRSVPLTTHGYLSRRARCPLLDSSFLTIKSVLARAVSRFPHLVRIACTNELSNVSESVDHHQLITSFLRL